MEAEASVIVHSHDQKVLDLFYSPITPDGFFLITGSKDGTSKLINGETREWIGNFTGHNGAVWSCCLDSNALRAATASSDRSAYITNFMEVWDALTGKELHTFKHKNIVRACRFSEDNRFFLTGGVQPALHIFDLNRPDAPPREFFGSPDATRSVAWLHSDQMILSTCCSLGSVRLWDARSGQLVTELETYLPVTSAEVSRDFRYITTTDGTYARIWDANHYGEVHRYTLPYYASSASLDPDNGLDLIAGCESGWIRVFDFFTHEEIGGEFKTGNHGSPVTCTRFSPIGVCLAAGYEDGTVEMWQMGQD